MELLFDEHPDWLSDKLTQVPSLHCRENPAYRGCRASQSVRCPPQRSQWTPCAPTSTARQSSAHLAAFSCLGRVEICSPPNSGYKVCSPTTVTANATTIARGSLHSSFFLSCQDSKYVAAPSIRAPRYLWYRGCRSDPNSKTLSWSNRRRRGCPASASMSNSKITVSAERISSAFATSTLRSARTENFCNSLSRTAANRTFFDEK